MNNIVEKIMFGIFGLACVLGIGAIILIIIAMLNTIHYQSVEFQQSCQAQLEVYSIYRDDGEQMSATEICQELTATGKEVCTKLQDLP